MEITKDMIMSILRSQLDITFELFKEKPHRVASNGLEEMMIAYSQAYGKDVKGLSILLDELPISSWVAALLHDIDPQEAEENEGSP